MRRTHSARKLPPPTLTSSGRASRASRVRQPVGCPSRLCRHRCLPLQQKKLRKQHRNRTHVVCIISQAFLSAVAALLLALGGLHYLFFRGRTHTAPGEAPTETSNPNRLPRCVLGLNALRAHPRALAGRLHVVVSRADGSAQSKLYSQAATQPAASALRLARRGPKRSRLPLHKPSHGCRRASALVVDEGPAAAAAQAATMAPAGPPGWTGACWSASSSCATSRRCCRRIATNCWAPPSARCGICNTFLCVNARSDESCKLSSYASPADPATAGQRHMAEHSLEPADDELF